MRRRTLAAYVILCGLIAGCSDLKPLERSVSEDSDPPLSVRVGHPSSEDAAPTTRFHSSKIASATLITLEDLDARMQSSRSLGYLGADDEFHFVEHQGEYFRLDRKIPAPPLPPQRGVPKPIGYVSLPMTIEKGKLKPLYSTEFPTGIF